MASLSHLQPQGHTQHCLPPPPKSFGGKIDDVRSLLMYELEVFLKGRNPFHGIFMLPALRVNVPILVNQTMEGFFFYWLNYVNHIHF